ncbi:MAG: lipoprotein-releasing ABC transporter permease subunit [Rhodobacteraceae bacterium]|nr:lipoprotein-releasing ABC transporter permease subunit [Paracoccaceae bacterium]
MSSARPFAPFEWMIAWRYVRARRAEGGVSTMTWISLIGIMLAVAALIITLAVRSGFRTELVDTILGANAHVTVYQTPNITQQGSLDRTISDFDAVAQRITTIPGVTRAAPLVRGQVMANFGDRNTGVEVFGITSENLSGVPRVADPIESLGQLEDFENGVAIGYEVARELGLTVGDRIKLISPNGVRTAFGTSPRVKSFTVAYIFRAGLHVIDRTRIYMPFEEAQLYFNRDGVADEIEVMVENPDEIMDYTLPLMQAGGERAVVWTWQDGSRSALRALTIEDNVMFIILAILVLLSAMNIVSGIIMLVKNKGGDIGILRTIGLSEGAVMRVFFLCGAGIGMAGTFLGVILGVTFVIWIQEILSLVNYVSGGGVWDPSIRGIYELPAELRAFDVFRSVALSLFLSFTVTIFPARAAARLNPVEALRYE